MPSYYSYRKYIDPLITRELNLLSGPDFQRVGDELATLDGVTYVTLPDGAKLSPDQPPEIAGSIKQINLDDALRAALLEASPYARMVRRMVVEKREIGEPEAECCAWEAERLAAMGL